MSSGELRILFTHGLATTGEEEAFAGDLHDFETHVIGVLKRRDGFDAEDLSQVVAEKPGFPFAKEKRLFRDFSGWDRVAA